MYFEREDWKLFRNIDTLCQKAGVKRGNIGNLVVKELVDNALDVSKDCVIGKTIDENGIYVQDNGEGIDPSKLKDLFSINRPLISSKMIRLPSRGALGNGLRVVTGAVIATGGKLFVSTKGKKYEIIPLDDGNTDLKIVNDYLGEGTRVEIIFGKTFAVNSSIFNWSYITQEFSCGEDFKCKTSPYWYNSEAFYELLNAYNGNIKELISLFNGINRINIQDVLIQVPNKFASNYTFEESEHLLKVLRNNCKEVKHNKLGRVGDCISGYGEYAKMEDYFERKSLKGKYHAKIPFIAEVWIRLQDKPEITVLINKTHITGEVKIYHDKPHIQLFGCGLSHHFKSKSAQIFVNIQTPYMPITSDGKEPDLLPMLNTIAKTINKAARKAKKVDSLFNSNGAKNEREIILSNLDYAIDKASGNGQYKFSQRQLYYAIRPFVIKGLDKQSEYGYFCRILTEYEAEYGNIPNLYRDPRGTLYHPHLKEEIPIGTIAVEEYERPVWTFNKILYSEKEGFFTILKDAKFPERYDCALLTSKGYASRAVKDLFDLLGETDEEILFFCIHDADAAGTKIYETLQEGTLARPGRKVKVINLGLDPWEALEMELEIEKVEHKGKKAVAEYIKKEHYSRWDFDECKNYYSWDEWLQENRVELNAMTSPQFIKWLEDKMNDYVKKVIPDYLTMRNELERNVKEKVQQKLIQEILKEGNFENRFKTKLNSMALDISDKAISLQEEVEKELEINDDELWTEPIKRIADDIIK